MITASLAMADPAPGSSRGPRLAPPHRRNVEHPRVDREGAFPPPLSRQSREIHPSARRVARLSLAPAIHRLDAVRSAGHPAAHGWRRRIAGTSSTPASIGPVAASWIRYAMVDRPSG